MKVPKGFLDTNLYQKLLDSGYRSIQKKEQDPVVIIALYVLGKAAQAAVESSLQKKLNNRIGLFLDLNGTQAQMTRRFLENWLKEKNSYFSAENPQQALKKEKWMAGAYLFQDVLLSKPDGFHVALHVNNQAIGIYRLYQCIGREDLSIEEKYTIQRVLWSRALIENSQEVIFWQILVDWAQAEERQGVPERFLNFYRQMHPNFQLPLPNPDEARFIHGELRDERVMRDLQSSQVNKDELSQIIEGSLKDYTIKRALRSLEDRLGFYFTSDVFIALYREMDSERLFQYLSYLPHFEEMLRIAPKTLPAANRIISFHYFFLLQKCCASPEEKSVLFDYIAHCSLDHEMIEPYKLFTPNMLVDDIPSMSFILPTFYELAPKLLGNTSHLIGLFLKKPELMKFILKWPVECLTIDQLLFFCSNQNFIDAINRSFDFGISFGKDVDPIFHLFTEKEKRFLFAVSSEANFKNRLEFLKSLPLEDSIHDFAFAFLLSAINLKNTADDLCEAIKEMIIEREISEAGNEIEMIGSIASIISQCCTNQYEVDISLLLYDYLGFSPQESDQS